MLSCIRTQVTDLTPLAGLAALQTLYCSDTKVTDLTPLSGHTALQTLSCYRTRVADLTPLSRLATLRRLYCSYTRVTDLTPLWGLAALQELDCSGCTLRELPERVRNLGSLRTLRLFGCSIPGVPAEVLSQSYSDNCLAAVRAHFRDLEAGSDAATDVKLIVVGNGRVGKTQICRRLRGEDYDSDEPSTHGIRVTSATLGEGEATTRLNIWDFGGQDLYHGTHALFLRTSAVFLLVWARETENTQEHEHQGTIFRNQPLRYWLAYVRHLAGTDSAVLIVQTRCDRSQDEALAAPVSDADVAGFEHRVSLQYSALNDRKREGLDRALREAVDWLHKRQGIAQIGIGRMRVQRDLQAMRDADAAVPPGQRQYRTITQEDFSRLCDAAGNVSSHPELLRYLHNAGIVFYRKELFQDSIVLDQGWALDAIYAVFNREKCWRELKRLGGRFTRPLLELLVWGAHSTEEQKLFLDMMQSCGICFGHRRGPDGDDDATEYIAPDLLPERSAVQDQLDAQWDRGQPIETAEFEFAMLHPGLVRGLICEIGSAAGVAALYWRGGVAVYETTTRSHALIEQHLEDARHGRIRVQTQGGQARLLLDRLAAWIERRSDLGGLHASRIGDAASLHVLAEEAARVAGGSDEDDKPPGTFGPAPVAATEYFVSYAWGDDTSPEGIRRGAVVDKLCDDYTARGIPIQRDRNVLQLGDSISAFVTRIGAGNRIIVVLSKKYLESPWCMAELLEIWKYSRENEDDFTRRVRVLCLPDVKIDTLEDRVEHSIWWKQRFASIEKQVQDHGIAILGEKGGRQLMLMMRFHLHVTDILDTIAGRVQPRSLEQLEQYGFEEIPHA